MEFQSDSSSENVFMPNPKDVGNLVIVVWECGAERCALVFDERLPQQSVSIARLHKIRISSKPPALVSAEDKGVCLADVEANIATKAFTGQSFIRSLAMTEFARACHCLSYGFLHFYLCVDFFQLLAMDDFHQYFCPFLRIEGFQNLNQPFPRFRIKRLEEVECFLM